MSKQDVTIFYQGGSGGFALFYYLLLSEQYTTGIKKLKTCSVDDLIKLQYSKNLVEQRTVWKNIEFWPDNVDCQRQLSTKPRLFLICNPLFSPSTLDENMSISNNTYKILLYTDLKLQLRMAFDKMAYWFTDVSRQQFCAPINNYAYIRQIYKKSVNGFDPEIEKINTQFKPDQMLRLEQFVTSKNIPGFEPPTAKQLAFLDYWKSLNSKKAINLLDRKLPWSGISGSN